MIKILVVGDVMIDRYIVGHVERISPEAPVPIVKVNQEYSTLGGAANVSNNLIKLQIDNDLIGAIGDDDYGRQLEKLVEESGIGNKLMTKLQTTITKTRVVSRGQQMLRIDREHTEPIDLHEDISCHGYAAILISDYGKGFCSPDLCKGIIQEAKKADIPVFIDPKGKDWDKYGGAFVVKPNLKEMEDIVGYPIPNEDAAVIKVGKAIVEHYKIENLIITRGDKGMTHMSQGGSIHFPVRKVDVFDVSGAGDTALAVLAKEWIAGKDLGKAIVAANKASSFVVTKPQTYAIGLEEYNQL